jgi:hypothetical protein
MQDQLVSVDLGHYSMYVAGKTRSDIDEEFVQQEILRGRGL